ncbi:MAG: peptidylprolyl isomerase [Clostridia bacterium]|nr:peptidylprolyl isomerase [Clostridia bacterium]
MKKQLSLLCALAIVFSCMLGGCGNGNFNVIQEDSVIASVNGENITDEEYRFVLDQQIRQIIQSMSSLDEDWAETEIEGGKAGDVAKERAFEQITEYYILAQKALELGIMSEEDAAAQATETKDSAIGANFDDDAQYQQYLSSYGYNNEAVESYFYRIGLANALYASMVSEGGALDLSDEEFEQYYKDNFVHVKHILVYDDSQGADSEDATAQLRTAVEKGNDIIARLDGGEDFETLIDEYNQDPGQDENGYTFTYGTMVEPFENAAFALKDGEYTTEPVKSNYGAHIIKRYPLETEGETYDANVEAYIQQAQLTKFSDIIDKWREEADIGKNVEAIAAFPLEYVPEESGESHQSEPTEATEN